MKRIVNFFLILSLSSVVLLGCSHRPSILPVHDEVLTYPLPFDLVFLRTLDAVQAHSDWELDLTDKEKGTIRLRNMRYSSFADADLRTATLLVKRAGSRETTIQLSPESQSVVGGDEILKLIRQYLSREVSQH